jgi:AhpD family alkylhydroperoxidase
MSQRCRLSRLTGMKARINNIVGIVPKALEAALALHKTAQDCGVPQKTLYLIALRASQINGCSICVDMHSKEMQKADDSFERIAAVAAWRDTPFFTDAERAVLALTEAGTRIADREDPVPDHLWNEAAKYYDERGLAGLVIAIATINVWNRFNVLTRQIVGSVKW